jgi:hypothetical protein
MKTKKKKIHALHSSFLTKPHILEEHVTVSKISGTTVIFRAPGHEDALRNRHLQNNVL